MPDLTAAWPPRSPAPLTKTLTGLLSALSCIARPCRVPLGQLAPAALPPYHPRPHAWLRWPSHSRPSPCKPTFPTASRVSHLSPIPGVPSLHRASRGLSTEPDPHWASPDFSLKPQPHSSHPRPSALHCTQSSSLALALVLCLPSYRHKEHGWAGRNYSFKFSGTLLVPLLEAALL